jgi:enoyl-CoA hydratase
MKTVILEKEEGLAIITINRPKALNALNYEVLMELEQAIESVRTDDSIGVVILTGLGRAFVAGADIAAMQSMTVAEAYTFARMGQEVFNQIETLPKIVIAAINGFALGGGCELAMACDIRVASEKAKLGQPEVNLGITPGFGGTQRLARLVGKGRALELIVTADNISAEEAERLGLVNKVVGEEELMDAAKDLAKKILSKGSFAVRYAKAAVHNGLQSDIKTAIEYEASVFALCFGKTEA